MRVKFLLKIFLLLVMGLFVTQALADHVPFLVPMKTVYPGQVISDTALGEKNFYIKKQAIALYATDIAQVLHKIAKRTLIKLRNVDSGVTISGMVLADGSVEVGI